MHARGAPRKSRREVAVGGPLRRAHPASGATWNVQVVRGKMTSRCLWHACRALMIGILLMILGAGMATIGYYAEDLSIGQEVRGNTTVRIKNESRGFHLNNLSYAGPIVMGFGGFIIVAACVMTFEARDSAAKVVPARFKLSTTRTNSSSRRTTDDSGQVNSLYSASKAVASQTNRLENRSEVFSTSPFEAPVDRETMTATLTNFSKSFGSPRNMCRTRSQRSRRVSRSGSVPNLATDSVSNASMQLCSVSTIQKPYRHRTHRTASTFAGYHNIGTECVNPHGDALHFQRHMLPNLDGPESVDDYVNAKSRISDRTKRSDTAKRHILSRQKPIHKDERRTPNSLRKRSADVSHLFRRCNKGQSLTHKSTDSSFITAPNLSPESAVYSTFQQCLKRQISAPLEEREFKSQISINSEPGTSMRTLSCQSSLEPYLPEESTELDVDDHAIENANLPLQIPTTNTSEPTVTQMLECNIENRKLFDNKQKSDNKKKGIYRSNSSRQPTTTTTATSTPTYGTDFKQSCKDDLGYDSIEVIDERRNKNFEKAGLQRSNTTVIYSEYVP